MTAVLEDKDIYLAEFAALEKTLPDKSPWTMLRHAAMDRFAALGFPTLDDEEWRFTPLGSLSRTPFKAARPARVSWAEVERVAFDAGPCHRLVFVDGHFAPDLSDPGPLPAGVWLGSLARAMTETADRVEPHLARHADFEAQPFVALNTALFRDGVFLHVPRGKVVERPVHCLFVSTAGTEPVVSHPRNLFVVEENAQVRIVESYVSLGQGTAFTNGVTEFVVAPSARVDHCKLNRESLQAFHVATQHVRMKEKSTFRSHSITLGGGLVRNDVNAHLDGEHCECTLNGLYLGLDKQLIDNHTRIDHAQPNCASHELYKGILDGQSRGVFNGKIFVHQDAQKTDAKQTNQALLLSPDAQIDTKPQLEIFADDVKCTHGATVGQLNEESIFYLRSRGIGREAARSLLTFAFANDVISRIEIDAIRGQLEDAPVGQPAPAPVLGRPGGRPMSIPTPVPLPRLPRDTIPPTLDVARIRQDFPILKQKVHGKQLVYLDNAATTQKPQAVLDALRRYYSEDNANVHRGVHRLSQRATEAFEEARTKVAGFLNAKSAREIVFTRGATEAINLVAATFGRKHVGPGDEVLITWMEHHSNIVPWQMLCQERGARLRVVPVNDRGEVILDEYRKLLSERTRLAAFVQVSNSLGTVNPVKQMISWAHERGVPVLVDGAQAVCHFPVDVQEMGCDFYVLSGHKLYGPTGIGVLYGKTRHLEDMPPYQGGGDMIASVSFEKTTYAGLPSKFEAGTPNIAGAVGLGAAIDYVLQHELEAIHRHETALLRRATEALRQIPGVRLIGTAADKSAVVSFVVEDPPVSTLDVGTQLDLQGIAVRTGHHCCQPVMDRFGIPATARASFAIYNTLEEVDQFATVLRKIVADAQRTRPTPATEVDPVDVAYPKAVAASPAEAAEELVESFDLLDDWNERYGYLIKLGTRLPKMPDVLKVDANRVRGCQSTVFLNARTKPGTDDVIEFLADSDADLVRGLLAVLQRVFSGQKAADVVAFDVEGFFHRLGLDQHLTMGRRNGLAEMVKRIMSFASATASV